MSAPAPLDPYAPPRAEVRRAGRRRKGDWVAILKWIYAAGFALQWLDLVVLRLFHVALAPIQAPSYVLVAAGLLWVWGSWRSVYVNVPGVLRLPAYGAVLFLFFPFYGFYWLFALHSRWCRAVDEVLVRTHRAVRAPYRVAMVASAITCSVPLMAFLIRTDAGPAISGGLLAFYVASQLVWLVYMFPADRARIEMLDALRPRKKKRKPDAPSELAGEVAP